MDDMRHLLFAGDYPDPSIVRVGDDYYCVHSSFQWSPGLLVWHSQDLGSWRPVASAVPQYDGDIWAPEIVHHDGLFLIYYKSTAGNRVVTAHDPAGTWSLPQDVGLGWIDPGHAVDEAGQRWLHVSQGMASRLRADGLRAEGEPFRCIEPWPMPAEPSYEAIAFEGPKLLRHGGHWHYFAAQGGTAGPATSHMVIHARGPSPIGPWQWSPHNPVVRTRSRDEEWWSVGHGSAVSDRAGRWWLMVHGYRKGFHTLGRQTLLVPVRWGDEGWLHEDAARPQPAAICGPAIDPQVDDDFAGGQLGLHWRSWQGRAAARVADGRLHLDGGGSGLRDSSPLTMIPGHRRYVVETELEPPPPGVTAGLCLYYDSQAYHGLTLSSEGLLLWDRSPWRRSPKPIAGEGPVGLRIVNDDHEVSCWWRRAGGTWQRLGGTAELSGYHHNVFHGFLSLRAGLCAWGGPAVFRRFLYRGR